MSKNSETTRRILELRRLNPHWGNRRIAEELGIRYILVNSTLARNNALQAPREALEWVIDCVRKGMNVEETLASMKARKFHDKTLAHLAERGENGISVVNDFESRAGLLTSRRVIVVAVPAQPKDRN